MQLTEEELIKIHRILGIGVSMEAVNLVKHRIYSLSKYTLSGIGYSKEILASDPEVDKLTLARFLSIDV